MEKRYRALRVIGTIYKVLGGIAGIVTILLALGICATSVLGGAAMDEFSREFGGDIGIPGLLSGFLGGVIGTVLVLIYGFGFSVTLYALGEGVYLLLALEENTRATVALLQQRG
jgi:vacuolar-type H+-ATPase subunit I/STV1